MHQALAEIEDRFQMMAEVMPVIFWLISPDWSTVEYVSPAFETIYGYSAEHVYAQPDLWLSCIHPNDRDRAIAHFKEQHGQKTEQKYRIVRSDGAVRWIRDVTTPIRNQAGELLHLAGYAEDITDQYRAERALRESETNFRALAENANDALVIASGDGGVAYANRRAAQMFGTSVAELLSVNIAELISPEEQKRVLGRYSTRVAGGDAPRQYETTGLRRDGCTIPIEITAARTIWQDAPAVLAVVRDDSERHRYQEDLRASLAEKEVLLSEVHHRVKNHLQIISALLELQADEFELPRHKNLFDDIRRRVQSMALIHDRLFLSDDLSRVDAPAFFNAIIEYLSGAMTTAGAPVHTDVQVAGVTLKVDTAIPCGLLLSELVTNILRHAFPGHDEGRWDGTPALRVQLLEDPDNRLRLEVRDNGVGLPSGMDWKQCPSLGLQLVDSLAEQINATVSVTGPPGTHFVMVFPSDSNGA